MHEVNLIACSSSGAYGMMALSYVVVLLYYLVKLIAYIVKRLRNRKPLKNENHARTARNSQIYIRELVVIEERQTSETNYGKIKTDRTTESLRQLYRRSVRFRK